MMAARRMARQRGVTLMELMVALLIGMILSLAMMVVLTTAEGRKRTLTSTNDINQAGNYAVYLLDQWVRSAGSGFTQAAAYSYGCKLVASQASQGQPQILPSYSGTALPAPFASVTEATDSTLGVFRLAPVVILPGATTPNVSGKTSDVLVVMGGAAGQGEIPTDFSGFATAAQLNLTNTAAFSNSDLVLVASVEPDATTSGISNCLLDQVSASAFSSTDGRGGTASVLPLAGDYHVAGTQLAALSDNSTAMPLGNVALGRLPQFQVVGVGDNNTLYSYDLLNTAAASTRTVQARADGVFELHALYGIDVNCDGKISSSEWFKPVTSATSSNPYTLAALMAGTVQEVQSRPASAALRLSSCASLTTANDYLQKILAIRVGLILRTSLPEKDTVTTASSLSLFSDLGSSVAYTRSLGTAEKLYRYRTVEATIPVRNPMMLP
jgi:type IV pilus assembly protein PilW